MSHWSDIRERARAKHAALLEQTGGDPSATALLAAAAQLTGVYPEPVPAGDTLLDGNAQAVLDRAAESIFYNAAADVIIVRLWLAHEYAHLWLEHGDCKRCSADQIDLEANDEDVPLGAALVQGYSPEERREREANVYARELLLPSHLIRQWYLGDGLSAAAIADRTGLPEPLVYHQLTQALLTPEREAGSQPSAARPLPPLDDSQREAAHAPEGPVLVEAGPGTGKTRTLVARVEYLLAERNVDPQSILCLTFSIKAAEEMRERIARVRPDDAVRMQIGTFHSFGLELLRKHGSRLGYPPRPRVLDPASALFLMERLLADLGLSHYQNLYEPTANLRDLLDAVSRAKDELCAPEQYRALAQAMRDAAAGPEEVTRAERALEVANAYAVYQAELDRERMLDFGDLIRRAVDLLHIAEVRADIGSRFQHILVDEYQDVNRASGVLLEELANENGGRGLWVVGDKRQSIYRWRGASPANMRLFKEKFPRADVKVLGVNYRSRKEVVDLVAAFAPAMKVTAGTAFTPWISHRGVGGHVLMEVAEDGPSEHLHVARAIAQRRVADGISYRDQAILCRSHTQLARVAAALESAGVPALYLGDLFERPEIRDMLCLLSLACQPDGRGLLRVARFPEYQVPLADALALIRTAKDQSVPFPRAFSLVEGIESLSEGGKAGLQRIAEHIEGLCYGSNAWSLLVHYLFNRSAYLRLLSADQSVSAQQQRLALYQLLQFAHQTRDLENPDNEDPKRVFLDYVRHLEVFGEEKQLRTLPESAAAIDAVRLLTVHGSKGLQFRAVHIPALGAGMFPANKQGTKCPPPDGMIVGATPDSHDEEEECLFFVAISRAEDVLCLSRPERNGKKSSNPSRLLLGLERHLPRPPASPATWPTQSVPAQALEQTPLMEPGPFEEKALDAYMRCPRQYYYERVLGLGGLREDAVYPEVHKCVYEVIRWIQGERGGGRMPDLAAALERLDSAWTSHGPAGHPYERMYRESAELMVGEAMNRLTGTGVPASRPVWEIALAHGSVRLTPDHLVFAGPDESGAPTVYRLRTGKLSKSELDKPIYGLYQRAFYDEYPGRKVDAHVLSLSTGERLAIDFKAGPMGTRVSKYDDAIAGIRRGEFDAAPSDHRCPRCPHYFVCPAAEEA